jgi:hypothetical protein
MSLVYPHTAIFFSPAIVGVAADPNLLGHGRDAGSFVEQDFSLSELVDDLFRCVTFSHCLSPPFYDILSGIVFGGQATSNNSIDLAKLIVKIYQNIYKYVSNPKDIP